MWLVVDEHWEIHVKFIVIWLFCCFIANGFPCLGTLIQTLRLLLDFRKAKNIRLAARVFFTLFSSLGASRVFVSEYPNVDGTVEWIDKLDGRLFGRMDEIYQLDGWISCTRWMNQLDTSDKEPSLKISFVFFFNSTYYIMWKGIAKYAHLSFLTKKCAYFLRWSKIRLNNIQL